MRRDPLGGEGMIGVARSGGLRACVAVGACVLLAACSSPAEPITIEHAWSPPTPPNATVAAVYMQITAREADVLLAATTPAAQRVDMHSTINEGGMMRMRPLERRALAAGVTVRFEPGGDHFMLTGLQAPHVQGASFPLLLRFANAGEIAVQVSVRSGR